MYEPTDWLIATVGHRCYAMKADLSEFYDPAGLRRKTARWSLNQRFTKERAEKFVDKMNAKGRAVRVNGKGAVYEEDA